MTKYELMEEKSRLLLILHSGGDSPTIMTDEEMRERISTIDSLLYEKDNYDYRFLMRNHFCFRRNKARDIGMQFQLVIMEGDQWEKHHRYIDYALIEDTLIKLTLEGYGFRRRNHNFYDFGGVSDKAEIIVMAKELEERGFIHNKYMQRYFNTINKED